MDSTSITQLADIDIDGAPYSVEEHVTSWTRSDGTPASSTNVYLTGPRGARYFLRPFLGEDQGERQVISCKSGTPMRKHGNEIRLLQIGDVLERIARPCVVYGR